MALTVYFASDHAGFDLKNHLAEFVKSLGFVVVDKGPFSLNPADDYPELVRLAVEEVLRDPDNARGIVLGGSGEGEAMMANRFKGIRATAYYGGTEEIIRLSREHNNANVLSLGARFLNNEEAESAVKLWLATPFSGDERHRRRIEKLDAY